MTRPRIGSASPDRHSIDAEIARLRNLGVGDLRARWRTAFKRRTPTSLPRHLLFRTLAYGLQADRLGDLDRLTRSLADFAKLVELFDQQNVSFVSVTQQFNTTTSMGRLTLNVLLSFAQFKRKVTSERIRDKIAASKRKGLWVGGMVPLGYDTKDRKITVNRREAERVKVIFQRYLELGSLNLLMADLCARGIVSKQRKLKDGSTAGGIPFTRGPLAHLLRNRFYIGEVTFKGEVLPGEQPAIIDRKLFNAVQTKLDQQVASLKTRRITSGALLTGKLYDDRGYRMGPSHSRKAGIKYRYYLSTALLQGQRKNAGSVSRVPAEAIEATVIKLLRTHLKLADPIDDRALVNTYVERVVVEPDQLSLTLAPSFKNNKRWNTKPLVLRIPWQKPPSKQRRELLRPANLENKHKRPIRSETRVLLVTAIARGRQWLNELLSNPDASADLIATRERCSVRKITMTISLAFLAPDLVKAALDGRLPDGIGIARLGDLPAEWHRQYQTLGLALP